MSAAEYGSSKNFKIISSDLKRTLEVDKDYAMVKNSEKPTYIGKFKRRFIMGSGDGQTSHWEFKRTDGTLITIDDEMYGYWDRVPIIQFIEVVPCEIK